jgi:hypothetical protein
MELYWLHAYKRFDMPHDLTITTNLLSREYFVSQKMLLGVVPRYESWG